MWMLRTEPQLVLKSRWAHPEALECAGCAFRHPHLDEAFAEIVIEH
jgi:NAD dependent epimerase/dehydratase family enzyme